MKKSIEIKYINNYRELIKLVEEMTLINVGK
jgi:hypothetical protein